jgi:hypothetical protein
MFPPLFTGVGSNNADLFDVDDVEGLEADDDDDEGIRRPF